MAEGKLEAKDLMMLGLFEKMMKPDVRSKRDADKGENDSDGETLDRSRMGFEAGKRPQPDSRGHQG